jgi:hypothetical protein
MSDDGMYDPYGDNRLTPEEVKTLKNIARMGMVSKTLLAGLIGLVTLVSSVYALAEHIFKR